MADRLVVFAASPNRQLFHTDLIVPFNLYIIHISLTI
jgi:hypothetical protein